MTGTGTEQPSSARASALILATDGSALGNPGPGGWAFWAGPQLWAAGGVERATNNAMELTAIVQALACTTGAVHIQTDSRYALDALTRWHPGWARRGWRTASGSPVANAELIRTALALMEGRKVSFEWVKAHAGHPANEQADSRARRAAEDAARGRVQVTATHPERLWRPPGAQGTAS